MTERQRVGFVGLGAMGTAMAERLIGAGYALTVYNRTPARAKPLLDLGAEPARTPAEAARGSDVVISMVADDRALEEVTLGAEGVIGGLRRGGIHLSMSTVSPRTSREVAERHTGHGQVYLSAPVFGRPAAAADGKLWICLSGDADASARVRPLLDVLSQGVFGFGDDVAAAHVVKLCGNFLIGAATEALAEAFTLAEKNGVAREAVHGFFSQTLFNSPIYQTYGRIVAEHAYTPPGFRLPLGLKDMTLLLETAQQSRVPMPLGALVHQRLLASMAKGRDQLDWTALALEASEAAGLRSDPIAPFPENP